METAVDTDVYAEELGLSHDDFENAFDSFEKREYDGTTYYSLPDYRTKVERGTVLFDGEVVRGFPKVPRTLVLSGGIPRYFGDEGGVDEIVVEEKINGYNVRVAEVGGEKLAFTRSGIVCPFTTRYLRRRYGDSIDELLDDYPDTIVCGEMAGKNSPYTAHDYEEIESLDLRVFDLRDAGTGEPAEIEERRDICETYGLTPVPGYGRYSVDEAVDEVRSIIEELDERGREGVIMKSRDVSKQLKYTTSATNQGDLAYAFSLPFDYGRDFMFRRIVREAFQSHEHDDEDESVERARSLGESVLLPMLKTLDAVDGGETVGESHSVRAKPEEVETLLDHLRGMGLHLVIEEDRREGDERYVEFVKKTQATNDKTENYLDGHIVRE